MPVSNAPLTVPALTAFCRRFAGEEQRVVDGLAERGPRTDAAGDDETIRAAAQRIGRPIVHHAGLVFGARKIVPAEHRAELIARAFDCVRVPARAASAVARGPPAQAMTVRPRSGCCTQNALNAPPSQRKKRRIAIASALERLPERRPERERNTHDLAHLQAAQGGLLRGG